MGGELLETNQRDLFILRRSSPVLTLIEKELLHVDQKKDHCPSRLSVKGASAPASEVDLAYQTAALDSRDTKRSALAEPLYSFV